MSELPPCPTRARNAHRSGSPKTPKGRTLPSSRTRLSTPERFIGWPEQECLTADGRKAPRGGLPASSLVPRGGGRDGGARAPSWRRCRALRWSGNDSWPLQQPWLPLGAIRARASSTTIESGEDEQPPGRTPTPCRTASHHRQGRCADGAVRPAGGGTHRHRHPPPPPPPPPPPAAACSMRCSSRRWRQPEKTMPMGGAWAYQERQPINDTR